MRRRGGPRPIPPLTVVPPVADVEDAEKKEAARLEWWTEQVGADRAREAADLAKERTGSRTLPELLTELYLRRASADYKAQFDLGWARPDFVVWDSPGTPGLALILRVQGDYWHGKGPSAGRDAGQRELLMQTTARGVPVGRVIDLWETHIYKTPEVLDLAYMSGIERAR